MNTNTYKDAIRATSNKQQATSNKQQATSNKQQATSNKQVYQKTKLKSILFSGLLTFGFLGTGFIGETYGAYSKKTRTPQNAQILDEKTKLNILNRMRTELYISPVDWISQLFNQKALSEKVLTVATHADVQIFKLSFQGSDISVRLPSKDKLVFDITDSTAPNNKNKACLIIPVEIIGKRLQEILNNKAFKVLGFKWAQLYLNEKDQKIGIIFFKQKMSLPINFAKDSVIQDKINRNEVYGAYQMISREGFSEFLLECNEDTITYPR